MKPTVLPLLFWVLVVAGAIGLAKAVRAEPFIAAEQGGVQVVVYTEPCTLKEVENLPQRATWEHNGKTIEGCAGYLKELEMVQFYFADRTVIPVPAAFFRKVSGA